jgi:hypothetical protein
MDPTRLAKRLDTWYSPALTLPQPAQSPPAAVEGPIRSLRRSRISVRP